MIPYYPVTHTLSGWHRTDIVTVMPTTAVPQKILMSPYGRRVLKQMAKWGNRRKSDGLLWDVLSPRLTKAGRDGLEPPCSAKE
jgi:hypothetical protein